MKNSLFDMGEQDAACTLLKGCCADMEEDELKGDKNRMKKLDNMVIILGDGI